MLSLVPRVCSFHSPRGPALAAHYPSTSFPRPRTGGPWWHLHPFMYSSTHWLIHSLSPLFCSSSVLSWGKGPSSGWAGSPCPMENSYCGVSCMSDVPCNTSTLCAVKGLGIPQPFVASFLLRPRLQGSPASGKQRPAPTRTRGGELAADIILMQGHSHCFPRNRVQSKNRARCCKLWASLCHYLRICGYLKTILWTLRILVKFLVSPERRGIAGGRKKEGSQIPGRRRPSSEQKAIRDDFLEVTAQVRSTLHREGQE